ncbi:hypothetical protein [Chitinophaga caseinilytica]|uniref:Lipoprotein n=1 Tax=Chitinophaga caseinilytica TaxID=2267521 RepID=A0ABZ2Z5L2_9BACT
MRYLIMAAALLAIACNPVRERTDTSNYQVIGEKCYVLRQQPMQDSAVKIAKDSIVQFLEGKGFAAKFIEKDSLMFRRANGLQVEIVLPTAQNAWESNAIIVFDPQKNPFFVNLHKGTAQVQQYVAGQ